MQGLEVLSANVGVVYSFAVQATKALVESLPALLLQGRPWAGLGCLRAVEGHVGPHPWPLLPPLLSACLFLLSAPILREEVDPVQCAVRDGGSGGEAEP